MLYFDRVPFIISFSEDAIPAKFLIKRLLLWRRIGYGTPWGKEIVPLTSSSNLDLIDPINRRCSFVRSDSWPIVLILVEKKLSLRTLQKSKLWISFFIKKIFIYHSWNRLELKKKNHQFHILIDDVFLMYRLFGLKLLVQSKFHSHYRLTRTCLNRSQLELLIWKATNGRDSWFSIESLSHIFVFWICYNFLVVYTGFACIQ